MSSHRQTLAKLFENVDDALQEEHDWAFQDDLCRLGEMDHPTYVAYLARRDQTVYGQTLKAIRLFLFDRVDDILRAGNYRHVPEIADLIALCHQHFLNDMVNEQIWLVQKQEDQAFFLKTLVLINFIECMEMEPGWILKEFTKGGFARCQVLPADFLPGKRLLFTDRTWDFLAGEVADWELNE